MEEMGSTMRLREELVEPCRAPWNLSPPEVIERSPAPGEESGVEGLARAGLALFWAACEASARQRAPMIVDY